MGDWIGHARSESVVSPPIRGRGRGLSSHPVSRRQPHSRPTDWQAGNVSPGQLVLTASFATRGVTDSNPVSSTNTLVRAISRRSMSNPRVSRSTGGPQEPRPRSTSLPTRCILALRLEPANPRGDGRVVRCMLSMSTVSIREGRGSARSRGRPSRRRVKQLRPGPIPPTCRRCGSGGSSRSPRRCGGVRRPRRWCCRWRLPAGLLSLVM